MKISPKLINVEENRVEYQDEKDMIIGRSERKIKSKGQFSLLNNNQPNFDISKRLLIGRFPSQLFTNLKNKYTKVI